MLRFDGLYICADDPEYPPGLLCFRFYRDGTALHTYTNGRAAEIMKWLQKDGCGAKGRFELEQDQMTIHVEHEIPSIGERGVFDYQGVLRDAILEVDGHSHIYRGDRLYYEKYFSHLYRFVAVT